MTNHQTDDRLDAVLADYFQRLDQGEAVSPTSLLAANPALESELREFFDAASFVENLAGPTQSEQTQMLSVHDTARNSLVGETIVSGVQTLNRRPNDAGGIPKHFGRYEIQKLLGQGAMGSVYLAYDPSLQRQVALKIPKFSDESNPDMRDRFLREARSAATLRHAHICPVYDVGRVDGVHFITMAYIEGRTLAEELRSGRTFEPREIAAIVRKLALALGKAHSAGVIHRDLKPGNIMLDSEGEPVLMDFGLAYREETDELRLTKSGMIVGSPAYMSPEQIDGESTKIGSSSDIYSLGVVLYEMITGKLPFQGTMMSVIGQIANKEPTPVGHWRKELADSPLERLCRKMLAKKSDDRPQTMQDVARALDFILSGLPGGRGQESGIGNREGTSREGEAPAEPGSRAVGNALRSEVLDKDTGLPIPDSRPPLAAQIVKYPEAVLAQERRDRAKMFLATTLILLVLFGFFAAAAGIVYVATNQGTLEITSYVDNVQIEVIGDNGQVKILDLDTGTRVVRLPTGEYSIVLAGNRNDVVIDKGKVTMKRGGKVVLTAQLLTNLPQPAAVADTPAQLPPAAGQPAQAGDLGPEFPGPQPLVRLSDHTHEVRAVAFAPGDKQFVTVGWDRQIRLWSTTDYKLIRSWDGHPNGTYRARFLPDGRLITSGYDATIRIWDVSKGEELKRLVGHTTPVCALAVTPDGKRALSSSFDGTLRLWDLENLAEIRSFQKAGGVVWDAALTPDGKTAATAEFGGAVRLWDLEKGEATTMFGTHPDSALAVAFCDNGRKLISGGRDGTVCLWDVATKAKLHENNAHKGVWIESISVSPDGKRVLIGLANPDKQAERHPLAGLCTVMDAENLRVIVYLPTESPYAYATAWSSDGSLVLTGGGTQGKSGSAQLWRHHDVTDAVTLKPLRRFQVKSGEALAVAWTPDGRYAIASSSPNDNAIYVWAADTGTLMHRLAGHNNAVMTVSVSPDGRRLLSAALDNTIRQWDLKTGQELLRLASIDASSAAVSADGRRALVGSHRGKLVLWDLDTKSPIRELPGHEKWIDVIRLSRDGSRALTAGRDSYVRLWDLTTGTELHRLKGHASDVKDVAFSADETQAISASVDGTVRMWNLHDGQQIKEIRTGKAWLYGAALVPPGQHIVTAAVDGTIAVWHPADGSQLTRIDGKRPTGVLGLALSPSGQQLLTAHKDGSVQLWQLDGLPRSSAAAPDISEVLKIPGHVEHVTSLALTGDGKTVVSGSADGTVLARDIETRVTRRALSGHRRDRQVAVDVSRDGRLIVSGDWDGKLRLNDGSQGVTEVADAHSGCVMSVKLSPDETKLLTTGGDKTIKVWNAATGELLQTIEDAGWLSDGEYSPSGELAVTSGFDGRLKIWKLADGLVAKDLPTGGAMISCVTWAPAGGHIAAGLRDGSVRVFSDETGLETVRLVGHSDRVRDVVFTPDGKHLISGSYDRTMRVWNVETGAEVARVEHEKHIFNALAIAPDGRHVFSAGGIWRPDEAKDEWLPEGDYAVRMWGLPESVWPK